MWTAGRVATCAVALSCAALLAACTARHSHARPVARARRSDRRVEAARSPVKIGRSVRGAPIYATEGGAARRARADLLVVGCIHGNEPAGIAVSEQLWRRLASKPLEAWLVDDPNPDGRAAVTRQNARGVDLNRNFPWRWQPLGPRGTQQYSGPRPLSEPESRIAHSLIARLRPAVTIWFHQPLGVVDESGGSLAVERRFARLAGLPLRRLTRYPGSAASWQDNRFKNTSAFVVELPGGDPAPALRRRWASAALKVAAG